MLLNCSQSAAMSNENTAAPPLPTPKTSKPVSEALLNEKVRALLTRVGFDAVRARRQRWLREGACVVQMLPARERTRADPFGRRIVC